MKFTQSDQNLNYAVSVRIPEKGVSFSSQNGKIRLSKAIVSTERYREITGDYTSTDEKILKKLAYLESFCRNIIRQELNKNSD